MIIKKGIKIKFAISLIVTFIALSSAVIIWYLSVQALKEALTENYLDKNYEYAKKVTLSTNDLLNNMKQNLETLSLILGEHDVDPEFLNTWREANSSYFNSLFTTDKNGVVQLTSPPPNQDQQKGVKPGTQIISDLMKQALKDKKPFISDPYSAQSGNLVVLISYPIFDLVGNYQGVIDGTIHLEGENSLKRILNSHIFNNQSTSVFVVDQSGRIIYHPNKSRINELIVDHPLVQKVINGESGSDHILGQDGIEYFSGYSYLATTGWGIITETPASVIDTPLKDLTKKIIFQSLPLLIIILFITWLLTSHVAKPINKLARFSETATTTNKDIHSIHQLEIKSNIYEVRQLYKHVKEHFELLTNQIRQDGLTGLLNRRAFDSMIQEWMRQGEHFSLIMLDIDRFKKVNDEFGHLAGDDVLRFLSEKICEETREEDLCFRYGGEEFIILLKNKNIEHSYKLAERLRTSIAQTPSPTGQAITISLGISRYDIGDSKPEDIIKRADSALYQSKHKGRNQTTISANNIEITKRDKSS